MISFGLGLIIQVMELYTARKQDASTFCDAMTKIIKSWCFANSERFSQKVAGCRLQVTGYRLKIPEDLKTRRPEDLSNC